MVRTRMAPSPTGNLHLGTAYAALWPYLFARKNKGKFFLRIEDTDRERSKKEFEENILEGLSWLGLDWDDEPYHQMDRLDIYKKYLDKLLNEGKAYYCFCSKEELDEERKKQIEAKQPIIYSGKCRDGNKKNLPFVVRFKMPLDRGVIEFEDVLHGKICIDSKLIGDTVIMRQNGIPLYNFANVVDDIDMEITHVIRGEDHISNTPKQVVLFEAFGKPLPSFAHYPLVLNEDRMGKLSKRSGTTTSLWDYKHEGYLPEALINYLVLIGWTPPGDKEILSKQEIIEKYDLKKMNKAAAAWNHQKLDWINGEYIRAMSDEELTQRLHEYLVDHPQKERIAEVVPLIKERIKKLSDFVPLTLPLFEEVEYDKAIFDKLQISNISKAWRSTLKYQIEKIIEKLEQLKKPWEQEEFEKTFRALAEELDIKSADLFQLIRVSAFGQPVTPPMLESMKIVGEEKIIQRVKKAAEFLSQ